MSGLQITVTEAGHAALVNAENTGTDPVLIASIGVTDQPFLANGAETTLPGELKQLSTFAGSAVAADTVHVTIRDDSTDVYAMRGFALYLGDGTLFALYGQADPILEKSAQAMLLLAADIRFVQIDATSLTFGDTNWANPPATTGGKGVVELATASESAGGMDGTRAVTPVGLKHVLDTRFGAGAPSAFVKGLLNLATAALIRTALELKSAALSDASDFAAAGHGHAINGIAGLQDALDDKQPAGSYAAAGHTHGFESIPGLQMALDGKQPSGNYAAAAHSHDASHIVSGTLEAARIPLLATNKVEGLPQALAAALTKGDAQDVTGRKRFVSNGDGTGSVEQALTVMSHIGANSDAFMTYHVGGDFACQFGLDGTTNDLFVGGFTFGAVKHRVFHAGNLGTNGGVLGALVVNAGAGGDCLSLNADRLGLTNMYGFGNEPNAIYAKSPSRHRWYIAANADEGVSSRMELSTLGLSVKGGFQDGSSVHLKTELKPLRYGLAEIERIDTKVGRYKPAYNDDGRQRLFLIAEQLAGVIPEAVIEDAIEFEGRLVPSVEHNQLIPVLIRAVQELSSRLREVEASQ